MPSIFLLNLSPIKIPVIASAVTESNKVQSIVLLLRSPVNPINDFAAMINKEVPTACFIGSLLNITSAGIIKKPPPAARNRPFDYVKIQCRVCGKKDKVAPMLIESTERYKCNKCATGAG